MIQKNIQVRSLKLDKREVKPQNISLDRMSICCLNCDARTICMNFDEDNMFNVSDNSPLQNNMITLCMSQENGYLVYEDD